MQHLPDLPLRPALAAVLAIVLGTPSMRASAQVWEPTQPIEIVVPAGTGGGADQMARFVQAMATKHGLVKQPIQVVNRPGDSGAEGLRDMLAAKGNPHKLLISLSSLFTIPLATKLDFNWRQLTPVSMLALDQFVLWVNAQSPYQNAAELLTALGERPRDSFSLGGTGSKQEDQILSVLIETAAGKRMRYVPLRGGGDVAKALAAGEVDLTVNNPIEAEALWRQGKVRPLCVFDSKPLDYPAKLAHGRAWSELPTCMSQGMPVQYLMLRGMFTAAGVTPAQLAWQVQFFERVRALPEWQALLAQGAFQARSMSGRPFADWLERAESFHRVVMREAKLLAP